MNFPLPPTQFNQPTLRARALGRSVLAILTSLLVTNAMAWGTEGHQVIASLAQAQLTTKARAEVNRLLALEPGETLASISTWADEHRNRATGPWHYVNFPRDSCTYDAHRDCPDGKCVVGAISKQIIILASKAPDESRLKALKYIVHLVGDVHQTVAPAIALKPTSTALTTNTSREHPGISPVDGLAVTGRMSMNHLPSSGNR